MSFTETLRAAQDTLNPEDFIHRVKSAVRKEISSLDSQSSVEDTGYFNHSAVPDFVVSWTSSKQKRNVYLRHSIESIRHSDDVESLMPSEPVLLAINPREHHQALGSLREEVELSPHNSLITSPEAVDYLHEGVSSENPFGELLLSNLVKGGRGELDLARAAELAGMQDFPRADGAGRELLHDAFQGESATKLIQAAELVQFANSGASEELDFIRARLSEDEIRHLLPWLLSRENLKLKTSFWEQVGNLLSLSDLEQISSALEGLDLSPLIRANGTKILAQRAYLGATVDPNDLDTNSIGHWRMESGLLKVTIAERLLSFSAAGRSLPSRGSTVQVPLDRVLSAMRNKRIHSIDMYGIEQSVSLTARNNPDIQEAVQKVASSLNDKYYVDNVKLIVNAPEEDDNDVEVTAELNRDLLIADRRVSVAELSKLALEFFAPKLNETVSWERLFA